MTSFLPSLLPPSFLPYFIFPTANDDDERDGLDIQSLSVVEAEFFFNKTDEGKSQADLAATKRTINLDAFHIIKVIGKGIIFFYIYLHPLTFHKCENNISL